MKHGVLKTTHLMIGRDLHVAWPPGLPAPTPPPVPYLTTQTLLGSGLTAKYTTRIFSDAWNGAMIKGTDIGPGIGHFGPPSVTLLLEMAFSGSKSHFGSSRYRTSDGVVAVSALFEVNLNLNCGTPMPTPFGTVLALATHRVDMSWGDILAGALSLGVDFLVQWGLNVLGGAIGDAIGGKIGDGIRQKIFDRCYQNVVWEHILRGGGIDLATSAAGVEAAHLTDEALRMLPVHDAIAQFGGTAGSTVAAFLFGGPMGADIGTLGGYGTDPLTAEPFTPGGGLEGATLGDHAGGALDRSTGEDRQAGQAMKDYLTDPSVVPWTPL